MTTDIARKALLVLLVAGAIYLGLAVAIWSAASRTQFHGPSEEVWQTLIAGLGVIFLAALWLNAPDLVRAFRARSWFALSYAVGVLLALTATLAVSTCVSVSELPDLKALLGLALYRFMLCFVLVGSAVAALISALVGFAFTELQATALSFGKLMEVRQMLRRCTTMLSVILLVTIAATSWLQRSVESIRHDAYPKELVFAYGLYFSAVLVVVYLPATVEFYRAASEYIDRKFPMPDFDKTQAENRNALSKELGVTMGDAMQAAVATLSPIIGAVLTMALGKN